MSIKGFAKDLVVLVADRNMEFALKGILARHQALRTREVTYDIYVHPERDPGCLNRGHDFLRPFTRIYERALVLLDCYGCGRAGVPADELEKQIQTRLAQSGWDYRTAAIVLDPELEIWVWSDSPHVAKALGWENRRPPLRNWLRNERWIQPGEVKPGQPKKAMEEALWVARKQRSSSIYEEVALHVSLQDCADRKFCQLKMLLQNWYPRNP